MSVARAGARHGATLVIGMLVIGMFVGALAIGALRFAFAPWVQPPHYHANWAVFIDGARVDLSADRYMEDVVACAPGEQVGPGERVHMHDGVDTVVHVHDHGVAWGHFFQNLGFAAGADYLILDGERRHFAAGDRTVKYVINGFVVDEVSTRLIRPGDRLLISYGAESVERVVAEQFPQVPADAPAFDARPDPAGCAGVPGIDLGERLRRAFWW